MSDIFSQTKRSDIMSKISSKDTKPEILVRKFLFSKGFRYRINVKTLPGKPDIVLPKYKTIIFVNGKRENYHPQIQISGRKKYQTTNREMPKIPIYL